MVVTLLARWHTAAVGPVGPMWRDGPQLVAATDAITRRPDAPTFYTEIVDLHRRVIDILDRGADIDASGRYGLHLGGDSCAGDATARAGTDTATRRTRGTRYWISDRHRILDAALAEHVTAAEIVAPAPTLTRTRLPRAPPTNAAIRPGRSPDHASGHDRGRSGGGYGAGDLRSVARGAVPAAKRR